MVRCVRCLAAARPTKCARPFCPSRRAWSAWRASAVTEHGAEEYIGRLLTFLTGAVCSGSHQTSWGTAVGLLERLSNSEIEPGHEESRRLPR